MKPIYPKLDQYTPVIDWMMVKDRQFISFVAVMSEFDSFVLEEFQLSKN